MGSDVIADHLVKMRQLRRNVAALRAGGGLAGAASPAENLRDVGHADQQGAGHDTDRLAPVRMGEHAIAQVLRIRLATAPTHACLPDRMFDEAANRNAK
jgi:hypothetical protein